MALGSIIKDVVINIKGNATSALAAFGITEAGLASLSAATSATAVALATSLAIATAGVTLLLSAIAGVVSLASQIGNVGAAVAEQNQKTADSLALQGIEYANVSENINEMLEAQEKLTTYTDNDLQISLNRLLQTQISLNEAYDLNVVSANLAYTTNSTLESSSEILAQVLMGQTGALEDMGFVFEDDSDKASRLNSIMEQQSGILLDASSQQNTYTGQSRILSDELHEMYETISLALLPSIIGVVKGFNEFTDSRFVDALVKIGGVILNAVAFPLGIAYNHLQLMVQAFDILTDNTTTYKEKFAEMSAATESAFIDIWTPFTEKLGEYQYTQQVITDQTNKHTAAVREETAALTEQQEALDSLSIEEMRRQYKISQGLYVDKSGDAALTLGFAEYGRENAVRNPGGYTGKQSDMYSAWKYMYGKDDIAPGDAGLDYQREIFGKYRAEQMEDTANLSPTSSKFIKVEVDNATMEELLMEMNLKLASIASNTGKVTGFSAGV